MSEYTHTPGPWHARLIAQAPAMLDALKLNLAEQERAKLALDGLDTPGMIAIRAILHALKEDM